MHLDVAGQGEELLVCRNEARKLGVSNYVTFHGQVSRDRVEELYMQADAFLFPSFREPSGSVEDLRYCLELAAGRSYPGMRRGAARHACSPVGCLDH